MLWIALVLFIVGEAVAQVPCLSNCPDLKAITNFDEARAMEKWYVAEEYFDSDHYGDKCLQADYVQAKKGSIQITHTGISPITGEASTRKWTTDLVSNSEAIYRAAVPNSTVGETYWILAIDYDNYFVKWSCKDYGPFSVRNAWIFTREQNPEDWIFRKAYKVLDENNISRSWFVKVDQKNCPEFY